jgi:prepilin peptidase CpaA
MRPLATKLIVASVVLLLASVASDIAMRRIPDWMPALLAMVGLALRATSGTLAGGLLAAVSVFMLAFFCWRQGWMGGGDVKLLGAATLIVPPPDATVLLMAVALAGGALAALYLLLGAVLPPVCPQEGCEGGLTRILRRERWRISQHEPVPYAVAIAAGTLFVLIRP